MLIRPLEKAEAPAFLAYIKKLIDVDHDFYDIVGARVYAEVLGWIRNRLKDPYQLIGVIDGHVVAFWNGRLMNEDINISLHSMAFRAPERPLPRVVSLGDIQLIPSIANSGEAPPDAVEAPCAAKCSPASTVVSINSARDFEQIHSSKRSSRASAVQGGHCEGAAN
jgi:hypothetical protein